MTEGQQPEALRLANALAYCDSSVASQADAELRRLHAENVTLQQGYDAARLEIDSLQARVQELGAMLRENRSKRIVELEAQLEAIGAGGVEPLRRRECLHQISEPAPAAQVDALDAAFEAVRQRLCGMQRYSFVLDDGVVRRVEDRTGRWIEFDDAHELFDPVAVDAARSQAKEGGA